MPNVIDIILHKNKYSTQWFVVLDEDPVFIHERRGNFLIAEDSGFFNFYKYEKCGESWKAFAGRKFDIPMIDGSVEKAYGQWWNCVPDDYIGLLCSPGVRTVDGLAKCNVFCSCYADPEIINAWLAENEPSNNYNKYDARHSDFGVQTIVSKWEAA